MKEFIAKGYMKLADRVPEGAPYYMVPYHPVSVDKKLRLVFDASCKTTSGLSLNDIQLAGPKLQAELFDILLEFRVGVIAITADIAKMYLQVYVAPEYWDLQRVYWRESPDDEMLAFWICVSIFGMRYSAYVAVAVLIKLATILKHRFPNVLRLILRNFYVDDFIKSVHTLQEAKAISKEANECLQEGGFELVKWTSNNSAVFDGVSVPSEHVLENKGNTSVLGLVWCPKKDEFRFNVKINSEMRSFTKRIINSEAAKIYDPTGYLAPITVQAKNFIQNLWRIGLGWDEKVSDEVAKEWAHFYHSLESINQIAVPRWIGTTQNNKVQVHGFADASERAFGCVVYARVLEDSGHVRTSILAAKSRLAPVQTITTPRLELCAAVELAELMSRVVSTLEWKHIDKFFWSDSEIVLHWIGKFPSSIKTFVAHRVSTIQANSNISEWRHVRSADNPADLLSRGMSVQAMVQSELWWHGPAFLSEPHVKWPVWQAKSVADEDLELIRGEERNKQRLRPIIMLTIVGEGGLEEKLTARWSTLNLLLRVTAYVLRFVRACRACVEQSKLEKNGANKSLKGPKTVETIKTDVVPVVSVAERRQSLKYWVVAHQAEHFATEIKMLSRGMAVKADSKLNCLTPVLDSSGIMRSRGRLANAKISMDEKHPIIIDGKSEFARLLIADAHMSTLHGGVQLTMQFLRLRYWITGLRTAIKTHITQ